MPIRATASISFQPETRFVSRMILILSDAKSESISIVEIRASVAGSILPSQARWRSLFRS
jgi:hypothetical protein